MIGMQSRIGKRLTFLLLDPLSLIAGVDCFISLMIISDDDISAVEQLASADGLPKKQCEFKKKCFKKSVSKKKKSSKKMLITHKK